MTPHSPGTDQIDTLFWIGLVAAAIIVVAVNLALVYAVRKRRAGRDAEPSPLGGGRRIQFRVAGALTAFAALVFVLSVVFTEKASESPASGSAGLASAESEPLAIKATGPPWLWRYAYPNGAVFHTWNVPDLSGKRDAVPGKTHRVVFRADEEGTYTGESASLSGQAYAAMRTAVEVVSPGQYEAFLKQQKADIEAAQDRVVELIATGKTP